MARRRRRIACGRPPSTSCRPCASARATRARGLLAAEGALPEELLLAAMAADPAREHEEQIGEPVQVGERPLADLVLSHEAEDVALGPPAHGPRHVEERAHRAAPGKHEGLERLEVLLATVEELLERRHLAGP